MKKLILLILIIYVNILSAQLFNTFDRANALGKGKAEVATTFSHTSTYFDGEYENGDNFYGVRAGFGINKNWSIKTRWEHYRIKIVEDVTATTNVFSVIPLYTLNNNRISLGMPLGTIITEVLNFTERTFFISPQFTYTYPFSKSFDVGGTTRFIIPFENGSESIISLNTGCGISRDLNKWAVRPEFGFAFSPGDDGLVFNSGIAFSYNFGL